MANTDPIIADANPTICTPIAATDWFVGDLPDPNKYIPRAGNAIDLLNCGEAYLPQLKSVLERAKKTVYIAIWGFNPYVSLVLGSTREQDQLGYTLEAIAKKGVEVKVLCWFNIVANVGSASAGDSSLQTNWVTKSWAQRGMAGDIPNLQFMTRDPGAPILGPQGLQEQARLEQQISEQDTNVRHLRRSVTDSTYPTLRAEEQKLFALKEQLDSLESLGYGEYAAQQHREDPSSGLPHANVGSFPTHHQKMIVVDHASDADAVGFVQGFNFWPKYFDYQEHPPRGGNQANHIQDVGLKLRGPCVMDLFYNFSQSWNEAADRWHSPSIPTRLATSLPTLSHKGRYTAQVLRTWRDAEEYNINQFYEQALAQINQFIFVEDQYFRQPEFARIIKQRAQTIRAKCGDKKKLYVFVVTNLNDSAKGGVDVRAGMLNELNQGIANTSEAQWREAQEDGSQEKLKEAQEAMEKAGVMVHICRLANSELVEITELINPHYPRYGVKRTSKTLYKEIYIHSKLTIFDGSYLTLGSANWNQRSMREDTELNIAIQYTDNQAHEFREQIWSKHTNGQWTALDGGQKTTPEDWYQQWGELLAKNSDQYFKKELLAMNLFPYFEDLSVVKDQGFIDSIKQGSG